MKPVCTAEQMRALDSWAINDLGIPSLVLMENAGRGISFGIDRALEGGVAGRRVTVLCGGGNNGGDGFVVARVLAGLGADVSCILLANPSRTSPDCAHNLGLATSLGVSVTVAEDEAALRAASPFIHAADVVVDALFGTGLGRPLEGRFAAACTLANESGAMRAAVDLPSGLHTDTGEILGRAVVADHTFTLGAYKWGCMPAPASACGVVHLVDIGIPPSAPARVRPPGGLPEGSGVASARPRRRPDGHKGTFGHLLVLAGSAGKSGASVLAGSAALRTGAGLVTVATDEPTRRLVHAACAELMTTRGRDGEGPGAPLDQASLAEILPRVDAVVVGPGLGEGEELRASLLSWLETLDKPAILDADALRLVAGDLEALDRRPAPTVLTPHPGEMAAMLGTGAGAVQADRRAAVRRAAELSGSVVALKGAGTLVARPDGMITWNPTGGPWLASAGTGDVLSGSIGALLAGGVPADWAAWAGVFLHGRAADIAARERGAVGLVASEVAAALPAAIASLGAS